MELLGNLVQGLLSPELGARANRCRGDLRREGSAVVGICSRTRSRVQWVQWWSRRHIQSICGLLLTWRKWMNRGIGLLGNSVQGLLGPEFCTRASRCR